ncbi:MAG: acyl-CoA thioesterase [Bacteroidales bacterium]|nr:acyl-CoA thioesterase [Bacteroidales bacterium]
MSEFEHNLDVRYYETDQMGVVHHSNYIRYFECGRIAMLEEVGLPMHKIEEAGIMLPIISVECRYKYPARLGDRLKIVTKFNELPRAKFTVLSEVYNQNGQLLVEGSVSMGFIDSATRRPIRCPQFLSDLFAQYLNQ